MSVHYSMDGWCYGAIWVVICIGSVLPQDVCRFGSGCLFTCRCADGSCDPDTGTCASGCQNGAPEQYQWQGPSCQIGNVAYHKQAWQKGLIKPEWAASRAVDGAINRYYCAHPSMSGQGWWMVDLGGPHRVEAIVYSNTIMSSWTFAQELQFFVSNKSVAEDSLMTDFSGFSLCAQRTIDRSEDAYLMCNRPLVGRYVLVYKNSASAPVGSFLACEVAVIGNVYIPCTDCTSECNDVFGCVKNCPIGKNQTTFCAEDCYGAYGFHCKTPCSGHCLRDAMSCDPVDGTCPQGCEIWWISDKCDVHIAESERASFPGVIVVTEATAHSLAASWRSITGIRPAMASHYGYDVTCAVDSDSHTPYRLDQIYVPYTSDENTTATLSNLEYNTVYHIRVTPYRRHMGNTDLASFAHLLITRTSCIAPDPPTGITVTAFDTSHPVQSVNVSWQIPDKTGCNIISDEEVQYSHGKAWMTEGGLLASIRHYHVFTPKRPGFYAVKVRIMNDQNLAATSHVYTVNVEGEDVYPNEDYHVARSSEEDSGVNRGSRHAAFMCIFIITLCTAGSLS